MSNQAASTAPTTRRRRPVITCFGCGGRQAPFVYLGNGHDYCVSCAQIILVELGIRPGGRRWEDRAAEEVVIEGAAAQARRGKPYLG
jgi:hypothetical protein